MVCFNLHQRRLQENSLAVIIEEVLLVVVEAASEEGAGNWVKVRPEDGRRRTDAT